MPKEINHKVTEKPWGKEILVVINPMYALKDIYINKGTRSSLHSHSKKHETIYIIAGKVRLEIFKGGSSEFEIYEKGDSYTLTPKTMHRVLALEDSRLMEVSTPELGDTIRHKDDFGRENGNS